MEYTLEENGIKLTLFNFVFKKDNISHKWLVYSTAGKIVNIYT